MLQHDTLGSAQSSLQRRYSPRHNANSSLGPDGVHLRALNQLKDEITQLRAVVWNLALGTVPAPGAGKVVKWLIFTKHSRVIWGITDQQTWCSRSANQQGPLQGAEWVHAWENISGSTPLNFCKGKTHFTSLLAFFLRNQWIDGQGVLKCVFKIHWKKKTLSKRKSQGPQRSSSK